MVSLMASKLSRFHVEIEHWVREATPKARICRELACRPQTLDRYLESVHIKYGGNRGARGHKASNKRRPASEYMLLDGPFIRSDGLKRKMIEDGARERRCQVCCGVEWMGSPIPLELHHVNGNRQDNRDENLKIICPNCHSLTDNYAGRANVRR